ncbi:hypothetical protein HKX48_001949 [Thoreauomyces humboldtii]|nr:hypothetical protein HKX48_001949 [Thoreauomyces humboldtii]
MDQSVLETSFVEAKVRFTSIDREILQECKEHMHRGKRSLLQAMYKNGVLVQDLVVYRGCSAQDRCYAKADLEGYYSTSFLQHIAEGFVEGKADVLLRLTVSGFVIPVDWILDDQDEEREILVRAKDITRCEVFKTPLRGDPSFRMVYIQPSAHVACLPDVPVPVESTKPASKVSSSRKETATKAANSKKKQGLPTLKKASKPVLSKKKPVDPKRLAAAIERDMLALVTGICPE